MFANSSFEQELEKALEPLSAADVDQLSRWFGEDNGLLQDTLLCGSRSHVKTMLQNLSNSLGESGESIYTLKLKPESLDVLISSATLKEWWENSSAEQQRILQKLASPGRKKSWKEPEIDLMNQLRSQGLVGETYRVKALAFEAYIYYNYNEPFWRSLWRKRLGVFRSRYERLECRWKDHSEHLRSDASRLTRLAVLLFVIPYLLLLVNALMGMTTRAWNASYTVLLYLFTIASLAFLFAQLNAPELNLRRMMAGSASSVLLLVLIWVVLSPPPFLANSVFTLVSDSANRWSNVLATALAIIACAVGGYYFWQGSLRSAQVGMLVVTIGLILPLIGFEVTIILAFALSSTATFVGIYTLHRARKVLDQKKGDSYDEGGKTREEQPLLEFLRSVTKEREWSDLKEWRWPHAMLFTTLVVLVFLLILLWLHPEVQTWQCEDLQLHVKAQYPAWITKRDEASLYVTLYNSGSSVLSGTIALVPTETAIMQILPATCNSSCQWGPLSPETGEQTIVSPTMVTLEWRLRSLELRGSPRSLPLSIRISNCREHTIAITYLRFLYGLRGPLEKQPATTVFSLTFSLGHALVQMWTGERVSRRLLKEPDLT